MEIRIDDLTGPEVESLIREHLHGMTLHSPPESIHALNLDQLRKPRFTSGRFGKTMSSWDAAH
jgi:putative acetyltransferase